MSRPQGSKLDRDRNRDGDRSHRGTNVVWSDVKWGVRWGGAFGLLFTAIAIPVVLIRTGNLLPMREFFVFLVPVYVGGGIVAGVIVGLLRPLTKWRMGAAAVGAVAMMPVGFAIIRLFGAPFENWTGDQVGPAVLGSVLLGGLMGWKAWEWGRIPL